MNSVVTTMTDDAEHLDHSGKAYSMTQLCDEFGLTPRALRFYEQRKLLAPLRRGATRVFTHRDRARLQLVLRGKRFGFTLTEIKEMLDMYDGPGGKEQQLRVALPRLQLQLRELQKEHEELGQVLVELGDTCEELSAAMDELAD